MPSLPNNSADLAAPCALNRPRNESYMIHMLCQKLCACPSGAFNTSCVMEASCGDILCSIGEMMASPKQSHGSPDDHLTQSGLFWALFGCGVVGALDKMRHSPSIRRSEKGHMSAAVASSQVVSTHTHTLTHTAVPGFRSDGKARPLLYRTPVAH